MGMVYGQRHCFIVSAAVHVSTVSGHCAVYVYTGWSPQQKKTMRVSLWTTAVTFATVRSGTRQYNINIIHHSTHNNNIILYYIIITNTHLYSYRTALILLCFRPIDRFVSPDVCLVVVLVIIIIYYLLSILYYIIILYCYRRIKHDNEHVGDKWRRPARSFSSITNLIRFPCPSPIPWTVYSHRCNYFNALLLIGRWRALSVVFVVPINHPSPTCSMTNIIIIIYIIRKPLHQR